MHAIGHRKALPSLVDHPIRTRAVLVTTVEAAGKRVSGVVFRTLTSRDGIADGQALDGLTAEIRPSITGCCLHAIGHRKALPVFVDHPLWTEAIVELMRATYLRIADVHGTIYSVVAVEWCPG